ncbi:HD domain-containing phosphohydrolase [Bacillus sp. CHD6a]|uniref:HD domain-containing phosphohydrolase n=1 Tax=Bacillus sp. CHD6a TaxID=1643452 RepID=UPI0006CD1079|nr:HD domain-containing phosphohydrolase [Bacillus sp. CHD6a]KPB04222.1 chemotaxis protein CheY [Bacillus sp. CHD6a]
MHPSTYTRFVKQLVINYILGSSIAVLGVGGILIFSTLNLSHSEINIMISILLTSAFIMVLCELFAFHKQLQPIKFILTKTDQTYADYQKAFLHIQRFPMLTVKRIIGPHLLGLSVPAITFAIICIQTGLLNMPFRYVLLASLGAVLIAGMHAFIEYFLTVRAIRPVLDCLQEATQNIYHLALSLHGDIIVSLRTKFLVSALFIGIFPVLLFSLATEVRFETLTLEVDFWNWGILILFIAAVFSSFGAFLLFKDILQPITQLLKGMQDVENNHLAFAKELYSDEFSQVIQGFNSMVQGLEERNETNRLLMESFYQTLSTALDARDPYTAGHSLRVSRYSVLIGQKAGLPPQQLELLKNAALLHDIGKIGVKDEILLKDGKLSDMEFEEIKRHPLLGATILSQVQPKEAMAPLIPGVRNHHERFDGYGYPDKLIGHNIPLFGRIIAVADAFDAMTSDRPYRKGMKMEKALSILESGKGTQWDPEFVDIFIKLMEKDQKHALTSA